MSTTSEVNTFYCSIDGFLIDAIISEQHELESEVSEYPVESGADITDNVRPKPLVVTMECLVSNTPIGSMLGFRQKKGQIGEVITSSGAGSSVVDHTPTDDCYEHLKQVRDNREPVKIITTLQTYDNMVLRSLSIPRATGRGDELRFTAELQQVQIVSNTRSTRTSIPAAKPSKSVSAKPRPVGDKPLKVLNLNVLQVVGDITIYWYDYSIAGWRDGVAFSASDGGYIAYKLGPYSVSLNTFVKNGSDPYWATVLENARTIAAASGVNPYSPFNAAGPGVEKMWILPVIAVQGDEAIQNGVFNKSPKWTWP